MQNYGICFEIETYTNVVKFHTSAFQIKCNQNQMYARAKMLHMDVVDQVRDMGWGLTQSTRCQLRVILVG